MPEAGLGEHRNPGLSARDSAPPRKPIPALASLPANACPLYIWIQTVVQAWFCSCQVLPQETSTPLTTRPCWVHRSRCAKQPARSFLSSQKKTMKCTRCSKQMEEGSCFTGQTGIGFLLAGFALPHLFFQKIGRPKQKVTSWHRGAVRSFRCPACGPVTLFPDEPGV